MTEKKITAPNEEQKVKEPTAQLSYEELKNAASDIHMQYQKLLNEHTRLLEVLNDRNFEYTQAFLASLFRVVEHPEMFTGSFVDKAVQLIEDILLSTADNMTIHGDKFSNNEETQSKKVVDLSEEVKS